jgi:phosphomannomutase
MENLKDASDLVRSSGADLGISFDGDADRAAFLDEKGQPIGSDIMTALIAGELLARQPGKHVLFDLRSSRAVAEYIEECGGIPVRERVGHSFMKATLREKDGLFGGELAGHYYFRDNFFADSALMAVVEVLNLIRARELPMSEIAAPLLRYSKSTEINFEVEDKQGKMDELGQRYSDGQIDYLDGITVQYDDWWCNVRPSNTEPYLRLVLEARDDAELTQRQDELVEILGTPAD